VDGQFRAARAALISRKSISPPAGVATQPRRRAKRQVPDGGIVGRLLTIRKNDRGATAVEYSLILALIFLAVVGAIKGVATVTTDMWSNVSSEVIAAH
jgi:pilus assembly protein Flp/PilA